MEWQRVSPEQAKRILLATLFADSSDEGRGYTGSRPGRRAFRLAEHQEDAVRRARRVLRERGGVLVADSVGLGKTYVALALIEEALSGGGRILVAVPASLRDSWGAALRRLSRRSRSGGRVDLTTHARLGRGTAPDGGGAPYALVVVDEAHRFRNPRTRRYTALARRCAGSRVVLLTATPVNNRPADLHHLLRLFLDDGALADLGVPSLGAAFGAVRGGSGSRWGTQSKAGSGPPPSAVASDALSDVRRVVQAVVIRRTRAILRSRSPLERPGVLIASTGEPLAFPERAPPEVVRYHDDRLPRLARAITRLELPACDGDAGSGGAALVRLGLLKRLDSSVAAFRRSLEPHIRFVLAFLDAADHGRLLRRGDLGPPGADGDKDPHQLVLLGLVAHPAPPHVDLDALRQAAARDLQRLRAMRQLAIGAPDAKVAALVRLCRRLAPERVLVFTEYRDTAEELWKALGRHVRVGRIDGSGAWLGARAAGRTAVIERFAPRSNGRPPPPARERVDVLVATEVLAEGLNLQDARHVVSFDLPWNPVRLLQRIGRVDRIGSPHRTVVPHLFVPARGIERMLGLRRTLRAKLGGMIASVGSEADDRLLARLIAGGPDAAAALQDVERRLADPLERLRGLATEPPRPPPRPLPSVPPGHVPFATLALPGTTALVLVEGPPGVARLLEWEPRGEATREARPATLAAVANALEGSPSGGPPRRAPENRDTPGAASLQLLARAIEDHADRLGAAAAAPPPLDRRSVAARLGSRLRRAVGEMPTAPSDLLARADRLLARLHRPIPATATAACRSLLATRGTAPLAELVGRLEEALGGLAHGLAGEREGGEAAEVGEVGAPKRVGAAGGGSRVPKLPPGGGESRKSLGGPPRARLRLVLFPCRSSVVDSVDDTRDAG